MCGIIGISGRDSVIQDIYDGLVMLQHRGQDAAGIVTYDDRFHIEKGNGLARDVFNQQNVLHLRGTRGMGHVRYTTAGSFMSAAEAQPFYVSSPFGIALIHNGNLTNYDELREHVEKKNLRYLNTQSDSEVLLNVFADEVEKLKVRKLSPADIFRALKPTYRRINGAYSVIVMIAGHGMLAFRDPHGIRPLVLGRRATARGDEYIVASESVTLDTLGFAVLRNVAPGEAIYIDMKNNLHTKQIVPSRQTPCLFEWVYIARPDSVIDDVSVYKARLRMGELLAKKIKQSGLKIDVVIPIPDTGRTSALTIAHELKVKYREGLIKNRYIGRTFIMPGQHVRKRSIKYKLNPIPLEIKGKRVLLVDDSIVRGNTSRKIIEMVRNAGAKKVYFASMAPALRHPCVYGVDMASRKEFVAHGLKEEEVARAISADALFYQNLPDLIKSIQRGNPKLKNFCGACFSGKYPTKDVTEEVLRRAEVNRSGSSAAEAGQGVDGVEGQISLL
ncbi:MAG: amidophosphoribosyltransferase [Patescibacteria group bacterium]